MYTGRGIAAIGVAFQVTDTNKHAFSLTDPNISYPYTNETVSSAVLIVVSLVAPGAIIVLLTLLVVPSPKGFSGAPQALVWRHKAWEWNAGWMGLGISLAAVYMATQGLKDLVGKPRPDLLARCNPDLSKIAVYTVGGLGKQMTGAPNLVTWQICQNKSDQLKIDGFSSFPSGHTSFSFAGLTYLTLWLCSKFAIAFPYLAPVSRQYSYERPLAPEPGLPSSSRDESEVNGFDASSEQQSLSIPLRSQGAAPPIYLQVVALVPLCIASFISASRWFNYRHHGFDILFGAGLGLLSAWIGFHLYHPSIHRGSGWAWAARSRTHAFFRGIKCVERVSTEGWATATAVESDVEKSPAAL
ncbi:PAP2 superfamily domain containing protein [Elaphomyces granulatus]